jgi:hypothetical protein
LFGASAGGTQASPMADGPADTDGPAEGGDDRGDDRGGFRPRHGGRRRRFRNDGPPRQSSEP